MAISAQMSIWGIYQYAPDIFSDMVIPEDIDRSTTIDTILLETVSLEALYSDPVFLRAAIASWSARRAPVWSRLADTLNYDYNPIYNYDRTEEITETIGKSTTGNDTSVHSISRQRSENVTGSEETALNETRSTSTSGSSTSEDSKTAYNGNAYAKTAKNERSGADSSTDQLIGDNRTGRTQTLSGTDTDTGNEQRTSHGSEDSNRTQSIRAYGNIGVTTTMQMIREQRDIVQFDIISLIAKEFADKFCIGVY